MTTKGLGIMAAVALTAGLVCTQLAIAQAAPEGCGQPAPGMGKPHRGGPKGDPAARLAAALQLTEDQQAQVKAVFEDMHSAMKALMEGESLSREDRMAKMKELRDASDTQIRALLTAEQQTAFDELRKQRGPGGEGRGRGDPGGRGGHGGPRGPGGGPGGEPPAAE